jgi:GTP-binding protein HflX
VNTTLEEIGAAGKPMIMVFNKIDRVKDRSIIQYLTKSHGNAVFVSAARGINMGTLEKKIIELLESGMTEETLTLGQKDYAVISKIHDLGEIIEKTYDGEKIVIHFRMSRAAAERLKKELDHK